MIRVWAPHFLIVFSLYEYERKTPKCPKFWFIKRINYRENC